MELGGTWRAAPGGDQLRRSFVDPSFDDAGWAAVAVPGHWRSTPALADSDGPVLYRRRFDAPRLEAGRRSFLVLDGCFYLGDVWLDGAYLGTTEGYFQPHAFEVTDQRRDRTEHVVAVELTCDRPLDLSAKRYLTGAFQHGDSPDPDGNPGGIWRPVHLVETGPVRIDALRARCPEASAGRAHLLVTARLDAAEAGEVELRSTVEPGGVEHVRTAELTAGVNEVSWRVDVSDPALWWPRALDPTGAAPVLVDLVVEARPTGGPGHGPVSDTASRRTGLRQVRMHQLVLEVNGERLFLKGATLGPSRQALGEAPVAALEGDVTLALDAGLDLLRVHAHISRPELYDAADRAGLLLWQDLPMRGGYTRTVRAQAVRQAQAAVDLLAHHPSVALWCAHAEPVALAADLPPARMLRRFAR
ncbi:MAG: hypothetical protein ABIS47_00090, partial [Acidimicrobiales bacterium]